MREICSELYSYIHYFEGYNENIPVIFSTLEGQYPGVIYCDDEQEIVILVTQFNFIFLGGNIDCERAKEIISDILFYELIQRQRKKEIIVFGQNDKWNSLLNRVFQNHHGVSDLRKCYKINKAKFDKVCEETRNVHAVVTLKQEQENNSAIKYPVARIYVDNVNVSFCSAFMLARGFAEIDVGTEEEHRQKGYAKIAAITLMKELFAQELEPCWCTWPYRNESQRLALSLGFELEREVPAYIWVEEFGL